jgi:hypothetical protein
MQTQEKLEIEQDLWEEAAEIFTGATQARVIVPAPDCECLACHVARLYLLPFLPVTWH